MLDQLVFEWFKAHGRISQPVKRDCIVKSDMYLLFLERTLFF